MVTTNVFKRVCKGDEAQDVDSVKKTRKRWILCGTTIMVFIAFVIGTSCAVAAHNRKVRSPSSTPGSNSEFTPATSLKTVCSVTPYPDSCISSISKLPSSNTTTDPEVFFKLSLQVAVDELASISQLPKQLANQTDDESLKASLDICFTVFDDAMDSLNRTVSEMVGGSLNSTKIHNLKTWLSTALIEHDTCIDALDEATSTATISQELKSAMVNSTQYTTNSLYMVVDILSSLSDIGINQTQQRGRRLLNDKSFPDWVRPGVRRLLEDDDSDSAKLVPNVTVAADGSGDVKTVNEAVQRIPHEGDSYFLIYVKAGTYLENVFMDKSKWNVFMYGDGMYKTIISGSRSNGTGYKTFASATLATKGRGFIMKDIGIKNTAGPKMSQAVAFVSDSDFSVYYQCSFDGYQDTLYPHSNRQFYRSCDVTGTVDFIFGYAAAVFQNCSIRPRQPLQGQAITITAQGRTCPKENSGFSIQRCKISPNGYVTAPTYLGRPWKYWSTTVVMESEIDSIVKPEGWMSWNGSDHMFYGEYKNTGPGSSVDQRVDWGARYKSVMTDADAAKFTVASLLLGNQWLPATGIPFAPY